MKQKNYQLLNNYLNHFLQYSPQKITKNIYIYFLGIVILNIWLKILYLDYSSFWYDEIVSVQSASLDFGHIKHVSEWDKNPPFYYYCLSVWIKIFNDSVFSVRLLSVIFSSLSAGFLFILSNKFFNIKTACYTSLFFIGSDFLFFYSHEARAYSLMLLLSILSALLYFEMHQKENKINFIFLGIVNFLLVYTHYISGLVIFFEIIYSLIFFSKKNKLNFLYGLAITTTLIFLRFTKKQFLLILGFNDTSNSFWLEKPNINYLKEVLNDFLYNSYFSTFAISLIILSIAFVFYKKIKNIYLPTLFSFSIGIGSIVILFIVSHFTPLFLDRYLIFCVPFIFLSLSYALSFFSKTFFIALFVLTITCHSLYNINYKTIKPMDYKNAVLFTKSFKKDNDLVIVKTKDIKSLFCYYYDSNFLRDKKNDLPDNDNIIFCSSWSDVNRDLTKYNRVIVLDSFQDYNPEENNFVNNLQKQKRKIGQFNEYKGVRITFYN